MIDQSVYFIQAGGCASSPIKIGIAVNVDARLATLQTANAEHLCVIGVRSPRAGDRASQVESALHRRFASDRLNGEWFRPSADLYREIERLCDDHGWLWCTADDMARVLLEHEWDPYKETLRQ